jgi:hypothetical protein
MITIWEKNYLFEIGISFILFMLVTYVPSLELFSGVISNFIIYILGFVLLFTFVIQKIIKK